VLDEAFAAIAIAIGNAEKNLANTIELSAARREQLLQYPPGHWLEERLADLCTIKHGFAFKSEFFVDEGEYTLLTPGNFREAGGYRDRGNKQKFYAGPIPDGFVLSGGDLLVAMTEQAAGLLGSPILVPDEGIYLHNQRLGLVEPKQGIEWANEFFFHIFNTAHVRNELHTTGTGQKVRHTSPGKIGDVLVKYPPTADEQSTVAAELNNLAEEMAGLGENYRERLRRLSELKDAILRGVFAGELVKVPLETVAA
jgi:type I restriction enzyme S subunit